MTTALKTANGSLITVGGFDDPFSAAFLPTYDGDHERYNLVPFVDDGDTQIRIDTFNSSADDNIFLAAFYVLGEASVVTVPEPGSPGAAWARTDRPRVDASPAPDLTVRTEPNKPGVHWHRAFFCLNSGPRRELQIRTTRAQ